MSDETQTETTAEAGVSTEETTFTQDQLDKIVQDRLARDRAKYKDYDTIKTQLGTLLTEKQERENAELSESQKLAKLIEEKESKIKELAEHKEWRESWEAKETEKINTAMDEFEDDDKELVNSLPLEKRMAMIDKLKDTKPGTPLGDKAMFMDKERIPTREEAFALKKEHGSGSSQYMHALALRRKAQDKGLI